MRILIIGAGGHAHVVGDAILSSADAGVPGSIAGYLDSDPTRLGQALPGGQVVGTHADRPRVEHDAVVIAIGDNTARRRIFLELEAAGECFATVRHPSAVIARGVLIGAGSVIMAGVVVNTASRIGRNVILNTSCSVDHHGTVGDHAHLGPGSRLGGSVSIGAGAFVGLGAAIIPGRAIGDGSTVGAGAVVIRDVRPGMVVAGVPAAPVRRSGDPP